MNYVVCQATDEGIFRNSYARDRPSRGAKDPARNGAIHKCKLSRMNSQTRKAYISIDAVRIDMQQIRFDNHAFSGVVFIIFSYRRLSGFLYYLYML